MSSQPASPSTSLVVPLSFLPLYFTYGVLWASHPCLRTSLLGTTIVLLITTFIHFILPSMYPYYLAVMRLDPTGEMVEEDEEERSGDGEEPYWSNSDNMSLLGTMIVLWIGCILIRKNVEREAVYRALVGFERWLRG